MKTISSFLTLLILFFLGTSGIIFIMKDIATVNTNLNEDSVDMLDNLNTWDAEVEEYRFVSNPTNYSLTGYETVAPEDKDNAESKGVLEVFLFMGDAFNIMPLFLSTMLPKEFAFAVGYLSAILIIVLSYYFTLAVYNAWKARIT